MEKIKRTERANARIRRRDIREAIEDKKAAKRDEEYMEALLVSVNIQAFREMKEYDKAVRAAEKIEILREKENLKICGFFQKMKECSF